MIALRALALSAALAAAASASPARAAPLTLDEALARAARANADLLAARAEAEISRADVGVARAAVLPRLDLQATFGREAHGQSEAAVAGYAYTQPAGSSGAHSLGVQASQPLVDVPRFYTLAQARQGATAAARQLDEVALAVAFQVTARFYDVVKQERALAVLEETAARSAQLGDRQQALFLAGRAPRSDTFTARVNLQNDRIAVEAQQLRLTQARTALAQVVAWHGSEELVVAAPAGLDAPLPPEPPALEALLAAARARRPALAADAARVAAARTGVGAARGGYYPTLALQGTYARSGADLGGRNGVYGDPARIYTATGQVVLTWNLLDGLGTQAAIQRAGGEVARAEAAAQRSGEVVEQEVASARAAVVALGRQVQLAADALGVARDALRLARERFDAGLATELEIRDANVKLSQAELTLLSTRIDHAVARADLARAAGGTF